MSVSRSGYYKWKYRQKYPTLKMISRQSDINLIKEIQEKQPSELNPKNWTECVKNSV